MMLHVLCRPTTFVTALVLRTRRYESLTGSDKLRCCYSFLAHVITKKINKTKNKRKGKTIGSSIVRLPGTVGVTHGGQGAVYRQHSQVRDVVCVFDSTSTSTDDTPSVIVSTLCFLRPAATLPVFVVIVAHRLRSFTRRDNQCQYNFNRIYQHSYK